MSAPAAAAAAAARCRRRRRPASAGTVAAVTLSLILFAAAGAVSASRDPVATAFETVAPPSAEELAITGVDGLVQPVGADASMPQFANGMLADEDDAFMQYLFSQLGEVDAGGLADDQKLHADEADAVVGAEHYGEDVLGEGTGKKEKQPSDKLAYKTYKVLDYIHKGHVGLEYAEKLEHAVAHSQKLVNIVRESQNTWRVQVQAVRAAFTAYAEAFHTANLYIGARTSMLRLASLSSGARTGVFALAHALEQKVAAKAGAAKSTLSGPAKAMAANSQTKAVTEAVRSYADFLKTNTPAMRNACSYLVRYAKAISDMRAAWFTAFKAVLTEVRAVSTAGRSAIASRAPSLQRTADAARRGFVSQGHRIVAATNAFLRLNRVAASGVARFTVSALKSVLSHKFINGVLFLGVGVEAVYGAMTSKAATTPGVILDSVLKGGIGYIIMRNPYVALLDLALPKSLKISSLLKGVSDTLVGLVELLFTGEAVMLGRVYEAMAEGKYGFIPNLTLGIYEAVRGNGQMLADLNERNLSGKNGAVMHLASGYGDAIFNGDFKALDEYQRMALSGEHGHIARVLAETGDYWARNGIHGGLVEVFDSVVDSSGMFADPHRRPVVVHDVPTDKGAYVKIRSCTGGAVRNAKRPVWTCNPLFTPNVAAKRTNVGHRVKGSNSYEWDPNSDPAKSGYGLFFRGQTSSRIYRCTPRHSARLWLDTTYDGTTMDIYLSTGDNHEFRTHKVYTEGHKLAGTCEVMTVFNE